MSMSINTYDLEWIEEHQKTSEHICVVSIRTTYWVDARGIHTRKSINTLKRKTTGHDSLREDALDTEVELVFSKIVNLSEITDGTYRVRIVNESRDWETNTVEDWDYELVPYP